MQRPLKQEVAEWKQNKVTKYLIQTLEEDVEALKDVWANGGFTQPEQAGTIQLNSRALGQIAALIQTLEFLETDMDAEEVVHYEH